MRFRIYFKNGMTAIITIPNENNKDAAIRYIRSKYPDESEIDIEPIK